MISPTVKLIECPRDAMQGWKRLIPTDEKIRYINSLLQVGFDSLDFGSFVSAKAIPQMADTRDVIKGLKTAGSNTNLIAIVANTRGAEDAMAHDTITHLGFPFSVSETFQQRNTHSSINESLKRVEEISKLCIAGGKELIIYISMGFGNPYGDAYSENIVYEWVNRLAAMNIKIISLADTVGLATADQVYRLTKYLVDLLPAIEIGVHLHSTPDHWKEKIAAASRAGCHRFDGALKGIGGCPMANDELVGNMNSEWIIDYFEKNNQLTGINKTALEESLLIASEIFV